MSNVKLHLLSVKIQVICAKFYCNHLPPNSRHLKHISTCLLTHDTRFILVFFVLPLGMAHSSQSLNSLVLNHNSKSSFHNIQSLQLPHPHYKNPGMKEKMGKRSAANTETSANCSAAYLLFAGDIRHFDVNTNINGHII